MIAVDAYDRRHVRRHPGRRWRDAPVAAQPGRAPQAVPAPARGRPLPAARPRSSGSPPLVDPADIYVVTEARYEPLVREAVPRCRRATSSREPMGRNTAAAVALAGACHRPVRRRGDDQPARRPGRRRRGGLPGCPAAAAAACGGRRHRDRSASSRPSPRPATATSSRPASRATYAGRPTYRVERFEEKPGRARAIELIARRHGVLERRHLRVAPRRPPRRPGEACSGRRRTHRRLGGEARPRPAASQAGPARRCRRRLRAAAERVHRLRAPRAGVARGSCGGRAGGRRLERPRDLVGPARPSRRRRRRRSSRPRRPARRARRRQPRRARPRRAAAGSSRSWASTTSSSSTRRTRCSSPRRGRGPGRQARSWTGCGPRVARTSSEPPPSRSAAPAASRRGGPPLGTARVAVHDARRGEAACQRRDALDRGALGGDVEGRADALAPAVLASYGAKRWSAPGASASSSRKGGQVGGHDGPAGRDPRREGARRGHGPEGAEGHVRGHQDLLRARLRARSPGSAPGRDRRASRRARCKLAATWSRPSIDEPTKRAVTSFGRLRERVDDEAVSAPLRDGSRAG